MVVSPVVVPVVPVGGVLPTKQRRNADDGRDAPDHDRVDGSLPLRRPRTAVPDRVLHVTRPGPSAVPDRVYGCREAVERDSAQIPD